MPTNETSVEIATPTTPATKDRKLSERVSPESQRGGIAKRSQFRDPAPMTSLKQIEANRRNALKSTGPRSENGKQRSRRNAVRHGLTAETTITEAGSCAPTGYYALGRLESATFAPGATFFAPD